MGLDGSSGKVLWKTEFGQYGTLDINGVSLSHDQTKVAFYAINADIFDPSNRYYAYYAIDGTSGTLVLNHTVYVTSFYEYITPTWSEKDTYLVYVAPENATVFDAKDSFSIIQSIPSSNFRGPFTFFGDLFLAVILNGNDSVIEAYNVNTGANVWCGGRISYPLLYLNTMFVMESSLIIGEWSFDKDNSTNWIESLQIPQ